MIWEYETTELSEGIVSTVYDESDKLMLDGVEEWRARLIAAAPELLAACKALYATHKPGKGQCCSAADMAIDAIAKAEGKP